MPASGEEFALNAPGWVDDVGLAAGFIAGVGSAPAAVEELRNPSFKLLPSFVQTASPLYSLFQLLGGAFKHELQLAGIV